MNFPSPLIDTLSTTLEYCESCCLINSPCLLYISKPPKSVAKTIIFPSPEIAMSLTEPSGLFEMIVGVVDVPSKITNLPASPAAMTFPSSDIATWNQGY